MRFSQRFSDFVKFPPVFGIPKRLPTTILAPPLRSKGCFWGLLPQLDLRQMVSWSCGAAQTTVVCYQMMLLSDTADKKINKIKLFHCDEPML